MKPDWDKLAAEYKNHSTILVADVDCTRHKDLCQSHGVRGYPTLKYGDPNSLEDYSGGRKLADLQKFVKENLKPLCSPDRLDLCDEDKKKRIEEFMAMSTEDLGAKIAEKKEAISKVEEDFQTQAKALQDKYGELQKQKEIDNQAIKESGLGLMVSAQVHKKSQKKASEL